MKITNILREDDYSAAPNNQYSNSNNLDATNRIPTSAPNDDDDDDGYVPGNAPPRTEAKPNITFRDLSSIQVGILVKIADGKIDFDNLTPRQMDTLNELTEIGLVVEDELTPAGLKAVQIAKKYGGSFEFIQAAERQKKLGRSGSGIRTPDDGDGDGDDDDVDELDADDIRF